MSQPLYVKTMKSGFGKRSGFQSNGMLKKVVLKLCFLLVGINLVVIVLANLFNRLGGPGH